MNLAYNLRPTNLDEFVGQEHLVGKEKLIRKMIESDQIFPMIFWGPPGVGKTTLASIIAKETNSQFHMLSGVTSGKADLEKLIVIAKDAQKNNLKTIIFIDEIHRWNKAQQDVLLPHVESGLITLIGATTENPSFEVISPLLSRSRIFVLKSLEIADLQKLMQRALTNTEKGLGKYKKTLSKNAEEILIRLSGGDARVLLNALEIAVLNYKEKPARIATPARSAASAADWQSVAGGEITSEIIQEIFQTKSAGLYDKKADEHYNTISAFIKSMRGSSVDGTLYYLAKMLESGEDPKFIARRMIIFASEDIGLADRGALIQANAGFEAVNKIGMPEAQLILAHIAMYLATAKKSRGVVNAIGKAQQAVREFPNEPTPLHLRNAPTSLMKDLGYAKNYTWSEKYVGPARNASPARSAASAADWHNDAGGPGETISFLPEKLKNKKFWEEK